jgi:16S rRNA (cytosine1402-N4)-methyltransferase
VLAVISFHSLEDRMVKDFFTRKAKPCICPPDFPVCACGGKATGVVMTPKAVVPGAAEVETNPRAASAKLRALRKL